MIDEKLMKVLECCANDDCGNCPTQVKQCRQHAMLNALDIIKRRDEEIEEQDQAIINALHHMKVVRTEAIKEFAEKVKDIVDEPALIRGRVVDVIIEKIDNLVKEMTEEAKHE